MCNKKESPNMKEATNVNVQDLTKTSGSSPPGGYGSFNRIMLKLNVVLGGLNAVFLIMKFDLAAHDPALIVEILRAVVGVWIALTSIR